VNKLENEDWKAGEAKNANYGSGVARPSRNAEFTRG
jgi:hypothetical protein